MPWTLTAQHLLLVGFELPLQRPRRWVALDSNLSATCPWQDSNPPSTVSEALGCLWLNHSASCPWQDSNLHYIFRGAGLPWTSKLSSCPWQDSNPPLQCQRRWAALDTTAQPPTLSRIRTPLPCQRHRNDLDSGLHVSWSTMLGLYHQPHHMR